MRQEMHSMSQLLPRIRVPATSGSGRSKQSCERDRCQRDGEGCSSYATHRSPYGEFLPRVCLCSTESRASPGMLIRPPRTSRYRTPSRHACGRRPPLGATAMWPGPTITVPPAAARDGCNDEGVVASLDLWRQVVPALGDRNHCPPSNPDSRVSAPHAGRPRNLPGPGFVLSAISTPTI